jgi:outer membrane protein assembly factor BamD (BamD/ComL family)
MLKRILLLLVFMAASAAYADNFSDAAKDYIYGDYQDSLTKAKLFRGDPQGMYLIGLNDLKMGEYVKARECFTMVAASHMHNELVDQAHVKIADTYFLEKNYSVAKKEYLSLKNSSVANNFLSLIYLRLAQIASKEGNWQEKDDYLNKLRSQFPASVEMKYAGLLQNHGDFFTVQIGAFSSVENADEIRRGLKGRYDTYIAKDVRSALTIYKVRVGHFVRREDAEAACEKLINEGYPAIVYP